jgi:hypothetical protein
VVALLGLLAVRHAGPGARGLSRTQASVAREETLKDAFNRTARFFDRYLKQENLGDSRQ